MKRGQSEIPTVFPSTAWVISILAVGGCSWAHAVEEQAVSVDRGVKIPMRDGINLGATIFKPKEMQKPLPGIIHFSPYIAEGHSGRAPFFARRGYVVALVDVRGRGNSEGQFKPFVNDGRDGHDVVEWLANRPWSDGKVAMFGGSYTGWDQWSVIKECPQHLETIIPVASTYPGKSGIPALVDDSHGTELLYDAGLATVSEERGACLP